MRSWVIKVDGQHYWQSSAHLWMTLHVATLYGSREAAVYHFDEVLLTYPNAKPKAVPVTIRLRRAGK